MSLAVMIPTADALPADFYRVIAENIGDGVLFAGFGETCQYASPSIEEILGRSPVAMLGLRLLDLVHPIDRGEVERLYGELMLVRRDRFVVEFRAAHADGRWVWLEASARAIAGAGGRSAVTSVRDIRWRKQLEAQLLDALSEAEEKAAELHRLATTDVLTGLANRRRFMDELEAAAGTPLALAVCDIDHFKRINDAHGHGAGDEALRCFAEAARRHFASGLVGRLGGEEFAMLMPGVELGDAAERCGQFLADLEREGCTLSSGWRIGLSASIGIAAGSDNASELMQRADRLLYAAKRAGRNRVACEGEVSRLAAG